MLPPLETWHTHDPRTLAPGVLALGWAGQMRLWRAARGLRSPTLDELVPPGEPGTVRWIGRNSLPGTRRAQSFEKRMARRGEGIVGYNETPLRGLVGPGWFAMRDASDMKGFTGAPGLYVDYHAPLPVVEPPEGWPALRPNDRGISAFVYGWSRDLLKSLAPGLVVGRAWKWGIPVPATFVLVRSDLLGP